jgi:RES domain-containing protein
MRQHIPPSRNITPQVIASLPRISYRGYAFRHMSPHFDPRSGEGAKKQGGRFNSPGSFATLYLAPTLVTVAAELFRLGELHFVGAEGLLPRDVYMYSLDLHDVIDLTDPKNEKVLGLDRTRLTDNSRSATQSIGNSAFGLGAQAVVSYSAAYREGIIIAVFPENLRGWDLQPELIDTWKAIIEIPRG